MTMGAHNFIDLSNQVFGELSVISYNKGTKIIPSTWNCQCSCDKTIYVPGFALRVCHYKSCGCKQIKNVGRLMSDFKEDKYHSALTKILIVQ